MVRTYVPGPRRFMYWAPWRCTRPWLPCVFHGSDEWHNRSLAVITPLGGFIFFTGRGPLKFDGSEGHWNLGLYRYSCEECAEMWAEINEEVAGWRAPKVKYGSELTPGTTNEWEPAPGVSDE